VSSQQLPDTEITEQENKPQNPFNPVKNEVKNRNGSTNNNFVGFT
jgi:hypothetical protein